jgi:DNA repair photolyase
MRNVGPLKVLSATKKHVLQRGRIACVGDVCTLNVARGCAGECVFCYARCYPGAPASDELWVYREIPGQLRRELDSRIKRGNVPNVVFFSTYSDPFLGGPHVLAVTRACLEIILRRGLGVSLSTRGVIPSDVLSLFSRTPERVRVTVPLASMSDSYHAIWEPGTATADQRLFVVQQLIQSGLQPRMRIEPIIPFVNDGSEQLREVISAIVGMGIERVTLRFLQLRRGVADQITRQAPRDAVRLVLGSFPSLQETGKASSFDYIASRQALAALRRIQRVAREHGLKVQACRCQNPGLPAGLCGVMPDVTAPLGEQLSLRKQR